MRAEVRRPCQPASRAGRPASGSATTTASSAGSIGLATWHLEAGLQRAHAVLGARVGGEGRGRDGPALARRAARARGAISE